MVKEGRARASRGQVPGLAAAVLLVLATIGLASACSAPSTNVTLKPGRPGEVTGVVFAQVDGFASRVRVRLTSGTGLPVDVQAFDTSVGHRFTQLRAITVTDSGDAAPWTTVAPELSYQLFPNPRTIAVRLTASSPSDRALEIEVQGTDARDAPVGITTFVGPVGADCGRVSRGADLRAVDLSNLDLRFCDLHGATLDPAHVTATRLQGAELDEATILPGTFGTDGLYGGGLEGVQLGNATLVGVTFGPSYGDLTFADLAEADLDHADLTRASLGGADLSGTKLATATLTGAGGGVVGTPLLPPGWHLINGYLVHRTAFLGGAQLQGADLSGLDLRGVDLDTAGLQGATLQGSDLTGARLSIADLDNTNLRGTDLTGADLSSSSLTGADVSGAKLAGANLFLSRSGSVVGTPATMSPRTRVAGGYLIATGVNLTGASLVGADLSGLDLSKAALYEADLSGADLTGASLTDLNGTRLKLRLAKLEGADLSRAFIPQADFTGATGTPVYVDTLFGSSICPDGSNSDDHGGTCQGHPWP